MNLFEALQRSGALRPVDLALSHSLQRFDPGTEPSVLAAAALASYAVAQGHPAFDPGLCAQLVEPPIDWPDTDAWRDALAQCPWVAQPAGDEASAEEHPLVLEDGRIYLRRYREYERRLAVALRRLCEPEEAAVAPEVDALHARLFPAREAGDLQAAAAHAALAHHVLLITGGPGTGKTTTVLKLLALLQRQALAAGGEPLRIRLAAPTGKAAARLNETLTGAVAALPVADAIKAVIPVDVATVHRLLGAQGESRRFRHHAGNRLALDVLVIDEASMLDLAMMAAVLAALPDSARLILLGDKDQLASVEAGAVMGDLCARAVDGRYDPALASWLSEVSGEDVSPWQRSPGTAAEALDQHVIMLRHSYRFAADRGIGRLAAAMQTGAAATPGQLQAAAPEVGECLPDQLAQPYDAYRRCLAERPDSGDEAAQSAWLERLFSAFERYRILAPFRQGADGVAALNEALDRRWGGEHAGSWYAGRPVMVTRNDARLGLMNGDVGLTLWSLPRDGEEPRLRVVFRDAARHGCWRWLLPARLPAVETVYAMTVHKSQGSEFEQVTLVLPAIGHERLTRELVYTALTRARRRFDLCPANEAAWLTAQAQVTERASGLAQSLRDVTQDTRS